MKNYYATEHEQTKTLLSNLLTNAQLFRQSREYWHLLQSIARLQNVAPFNAMLLLIQKPGICYVTSQYEWENIYHRPLKPDARPLIILWPFAPVAFVYDIEDTLGQHISEPAYAEMFVTSGREFGRDFMDKLGETLDKNHIHCQLVKHAPHYGGHIRKTVLLKDNKEANEYHIGLNKDHSPTVQLTTLIHELGHLFLEHLGADNELKIRGRTGLQRAGQELEAESWSYLVCSRIGIQTDSQQYLAGYVTQHDTIGDIEIYEIMRAANRIEHLLDMGVHIRFR